MKAKPKLISTTEDRAEPRIGIRERVEARILSVPGRMLDDADHFSCETCDLSFSGVRLLTREPLDVGMLLDVAVHVDGFPSEFLHLGQVRWVLVDEAKKGFQVGLQFVFTSTVSRDLWRSYVAKVLGVDVSDVENPEAKSA